MKIISKENLAQVVGTVKQGKVVIFPSETSYGLSCDALNQKAVDRIFVIKGREREKSLLIIVSSVEMAKKYLVWNEATEKLASKYWPGPLTIVGASTVNNGLAHGVVASDGTVAVRVSAYLPLINLTDTLGGPVISTSANISGHDAVYNAEDARDIFGTAENMPDAFYSMGDLPKRSATTIVKVVGEQVEILRKGDLEIYE